VSLLLVVELVLFVVHVEFVIVLVTEMFVQLSLIVHVLLLHVVLVVLSDKDTVVFVLELTVLQDAVLDLDELFKEEVIT
jgi:hypothetical protein